MTVEQNVLQQNSQKVGVSRVTPHYGQCDHRVPQPCQPEQCLSLQTAPPAPQHCQPCPPTLHTHIPLPCHTRPSMDVMTCSSPTSSSQLCISILGQASDPYPSPILLQAFSTCSVHSVLLSGNVALGAGDGPPRRCECRRGAPSIPGRGCVYYRLWSGSLILEEILYPPSL